MNFSVVGSPTPRYDRPASGKRPGSARPHSMRNPITGEEIPERVNSRADTHPAQTQSKPSRTQGGIPGLDLKYLKEVDDYVYKPVEIGNYPLRSPTESARTDVSWGTEVSTARSERLSSRRNTTRNERGGSSSRQTGMLGLDLQDVDEYGDPVRKPANHKKKGTVWDEPAIPDPDSCAPPSQRHTQMYKEYEEEMKSAYRNKDNYDFTQEEINQAIEEVRERHPELDFNSEEIIEKGWTKRQNQAAKQYLKKMDAEDLLEQNKKLKMVETVMADQLSRAVISDPDQNTKGQVNPGGRRPRGSNRALHDSKVRTASSATENLLSQRVRFGARILTRNGHDAIRELTGFFFSVDNTLTIYEFRQFGKSAKALPFINRGQYLHLMGPREGEPYTLADICSGNDLVISTTGQHSLPETLKRLAEVTFRLTDVDEVEKRRNMLKDVPSQHAEEAYARLHILNKQEHTEKMVIKSIQSNVHKKIRKRAIRTITGLGRFYRKSNSSGTGILYRFELEKGLFEFHIDLPPDTLDALFEILDTAEKGELDYGVYMRAVLGNMVEARKCLVIKAFRKIDAGKKGYITLSDIQKFFNSTFRPGKEPSGDSGVGPLQSFLDAVLPNKKQEDLSFVEFEEYYEGLSLSIDDDKDFYAVLRNTWTI